MKAPTHLKAAVVVAQRALITVIVIVIQTLVRAPRLQPQAQVLTQLILVQVKRFKNFFS